MSDRTAFGQIVRDVASDFGRTVTDDEAAFILWEHTGYPFFWHSGDVVADCVAQVDRYFSLGEHGWASCVCCGRPALATEQMCMCEPCDREATLAHTDGGRRSVA